MTNVAIQAAGPDEKWITHHVSCIGDRIMSGKVVSSRFQEAIETVEALPPDDQTLLIEIVRRRLIELRRAELAEDIEEAHSAYELGAVRRGTAAELMEGRDRSAT
jgi:hypothetical protein